MINHVSKLCRILEECEYDFGCIVLTSKYSAFCHPDQDTGKGVFIAPMRADRQGGDRDYKCKWEFEQRFLIAPFVKCEIDELNQILKMNGEIKGGLVEAWECLEKLKECIKCENDFDSCDPKDPYFILEQISLPDCCNQHVVLPTIWKTNFYC